MGRSIIFLEDLEGPDLVDELEGVAQSGRYFDYLDERSDVEPILMAMVPMGVNAVEEAMLDSIEFRPRGPRKVRKLES